MQKDELVQNGLKEMEEVLKRADVGRMALCDGSLPYIVPLNFVYDKGKIAFHCAWEGKKLDLIKSNPNCCFEVDEFMGKVTYHYATKCHFDYDSVLALGKARIESNESERIRLLQLMAEKYDERYRKPVAEGGRRIGSIEEDHRRARASDRSIGECCCIVIDIEHLTGRREKTVDGKRQKTMWCHKF